MFYAIWSPFTFLVGYNDPRKPTDDLLHGETMPLLVVSLPATLYCSQAVRAYQVIWHVPLKVDER